jgi:hypothetical protein
MLSCGEKFRAKYNQNNMGRHNYSYENVCVSLQDLTQLIQLHLMQCCNKVVINTQQLHMVVTM